MDSGPEKELFKPGEIAILTVAPGESVSTNPYCPFKNGEELEIGKEWWLGTARTLTGEVWYEIAGTIWIVQHKVLRRRKPPEEYDGNKTCDWDLVPYSFLIRKKTPKVKVPLR